MISGPGLDSGDTTTRFGAPNANGANDDPATDTFAIAIGTMLTRRSSSAFDLFDHLEQQLQTAKRVPTAQVHETPEAYEVKATERTLLISAWRRSFRFPVAIEREQLQAFYRDGLLTVTAPRANKVSTVTVAVEVGVALAQQLPGAGVGTELLAAIAASAAGGGAGGGAIGDHRCRVRPRRKSQGRSCRPPAATPASDAGWLARYSASRYSLASQLLRWRR